MNKMKQVLQLFTTIYACHLGHLIQNRGQGRVGCLPQLHGTIPPGGWMVEGQPYAITISEKNGDLNGAR